MSFRIDKLGIPLGDENGALIPLFYLPNGGRLIESPKRLPKAFDVREIPRWKTCAKTPTESPTMILRAYFRRRSQPDRDLRGPVRRLERRPPPRQLTWTLARYVRDHAFPGLTTCGGDWHRHVSKPPHRCITLRKNTRNNWQNSYAQQHDQSQKR